MQHRLEGDAVAGGFALGLTLLGVFDALDAQLAPVLAHVAETVGQRYVIVLGIAISTAAIGLIERAIGHLGDAQLEQSEQLTQRFRYGLIALIGGLGQASMRRRSASASSGSILSPAISDWRMVS